MAALSVPPRGPHQAMSAIRRRGRESTPASGLPSPNGVDDPQAKGWHGTTPQKLEMPKSLDEATALYMRFEEWLTPLLLTIVSFFIRFRNIAVWDKVWWVGHGP